MTRTQNKTRFLVFLLCLAVSDFVVAQSHPVEMSYEAGIDHYNFLRDKLGGYDVFFDGESHNVASNEVRHFNLFRFLNSNFGVRYYIKEYDFQYGYSVNKYLQTGDEAWFGRGPSKEAVEFYRKLYELNRTLPEGEKITFISLDAYAFRDTEEFLARMTHGKGSAPSVVDEVLTVLKGIKKTDTRGMGMDVRGKDKAEIMSALKEVRKKVVAGESHFREYFGDDYVFFYLMVFNHASEKRTDENLLQNFLEFKRLVGGSKYYFHYGNLHCQLKGGWLASKLNDVEGFRGKVCSFTAQYRDSEYYWPYEIRKETNFGIVNSGSYSTSAIDKLLSIPYDCSITAATEIGGGLDKGTTYVYFLRDQKAMNSNHQKP
ncbi:MAG: hypothetical protein JNN04_05875 [Cyclobacteriaceae bacterium]|nr:hypothetical protein [Cyclobacteriaceae bacterium]